MVWNADSILNDFWLGRPACSQAADKPRLRERFRGQTAPWGSCVGSGCEGILLHKSISASSALNSDSQKSEHGARRAQARCSLLRLICRWFMRLACEIAGMRPDLHAHTLRPPVGMNRDTAGARHICSAALRRLRAAMIFSLSIDFCAFDALPLCTLSVLFRGLAEITFAIGSFCDAAFSCL